MAQPSPNYPAATCRPDSSDLATALAGLLAAHDGGQARGTPLLTAAGVAHVRGLVRAARAAWAAPSLPASPLVLPHWDDADRRLWLGGLLLKTFRQPGTHQVLLLAAFEEDRWAGHVDDPLPPQAEDGPGEARRRLRETIHNLNQTLPAGTIRFRGDGTGEGVRRSRAARRPDRRNRRREMCS